MGVLPLTNHPQINTIIKGFEEEKIPFVKVHRMIDLFETMIKTHTAYVIADYLRINDMADSIKGLLANGLTSPSLGLWQLFGRTIIADLITPRKMTAHTYEEVLETLDKNQKNNFKKFYLKKDGHYFLNKGLTSNELKSLRKCYKRSNYRFSPAMFFPKYIERFFEWDQKIQEVRELPDGTKLLDVVAFRNHYAHGATPSKEVCEQHLEQYVPILIELLQDPLFQTARIVVVDESFHEIQLSEAVRPIDEAALNEIIKKNDDLKPNYPYLVNENLEVLCLFPIMHYKNLEHLGDVNLFYLNDLKKWNNNILSLLEYPHAYHHYDDERFHEFEKLIRVNEWKELYTDEFRDTVVALSETFFGRTEELQILKTFVQQEPSGHMFLYGEPGIGKSSIMAKLLYECKYEGSEGGSEDFSDVVFIEYFIKKNTIFADPNYFLDTLLEKLELVCPYLQKKTGQSLTEKAKILHKYLQTFALEEKKRKLVFLIDGLDEGKDTEILDYLVTSSFANVLMIYASRPDSDVFLKEKSMSQLKSPLHLRKLSEEEIRAILYSVTDKYEVISRESYYESIILERSDGNPLYLKFLCQEIESKEISLADIKKIPKRLEGYYAKIISSYSKNEEAQLVFEVLCLIMAAKDYIDAHQLEYILMDSIAPIKVEKALLTLSEILQKNPQNDEQYQVFHESLRDYFLKKYPDHIKRAKEKLLQYCSKWETLESHFPSVSLYQLEHYADHLKDADDREGLLSVLQNPHFVQKQIRETGHYEASFRLCRIAQNMAKAHMNEGDPRELDKALLMESMLAFLQIHQDFDHNKKVYEGTVRKGELEVWLKQIPLYNDEEKAAAYLCLLQYCLQEDDQAGITRIIEHIDNYTEIDPSSFSFNKIVPLHVVFEIVQLLKTNGYPYQVIMKRCLLEASEVNMMIDHYSFRQELEQVIEECKTSVFIEGRPNNEALKIAVSIHVCERLVELSYMDRAKKLANNIYEEWIRHGIKDVTTLSDLALVLCKCDEWEKGKKIISTFDSDQRIAATIEIISYLLKREEDQAIREWIEVKNQVSKNEILNKLPWNAKILDVILPIDKGYYQSIKAEYKTFLGSNEIAKPLKNSCLLDFGKHLYRCGLIDELVELCFSISDLKLKGSLLALCFAKTSSKKIEKAVLTWVGQIQNQYYKYDSDLEKIFKTSILIGHKDISGKIQAIPFDKETNMFMKRMAAEAYMELNQYDQILAIVKEQQDDWHLASVAGEYFVRTDQLQLLFDTVESLRIMAKENMLTGAAKAALALEQQAAFTEIIGKITDVSNLKSLLKAHFQEYSNHHETAQTLAYIISELAQISDLLTKDDQDEIALALIEKHLQEGKKEFSIPFAIADVNYDLQIEAYQRLVKQALEKEDIDYALQLLDEIDPYDFIQEARYMKYELHKLIVLKMCEMGDKRALQELADSFLGCDYYRDIADLIETTLKAASYIYVRNQREEIKKILVKAEKKITQSKAEILYLDVALFYHSIGQAKEAMRLVRRAFDTTKDFTESDIMKFAYVEQSLDYGPFLQQRLKKKGIILNEENFLDKAKDVFGFITYLECIIKDQKLIEAREMAAMLPVQHQSRLYLKIMEKYLEADQFEDALACFDKIAEHELEALSILLDYCQTIEQCKNVWDRKTDEFIFNGQNTLRKLEGKQYLFFITIMDELEEGKKVQLEKWLLLHLLKACQHHDHLIFTFMSKISFDRIRVHKLMMLYAYFLYYFHSGESRELHFLAKLTKTLQLKDIDIEDPGSAAPAVVPDIRHQLDKLEAGLITLKQFKQFVLEM